MSWRRSGLLALASVLVSAAPASAEPGFVLSPSPDCVFGASAACQTHGITTQPLFSPDGQMAYVYPDATTYATAFARDPQTGALSPLPCDAPSGGDRCIPPADSWLIAPDGRALYRVAQNHLEVYSRAEDGGASFFQCVQIKDGTDAQCHAKNQDRVGAAWMSTGGEYLYVQAASDSGQELVKFARDAASGRLTPIDCLSEVDVAGCTTDAQLTALEVDPVDAQFPHVIADGQDLYVVAGGRHFLEFRPDANTGKLARTGEVSINGDVVRPVESAVLSPDGRWLYVVGPGPSVIVLPRDPATGQLGAPLCRKGCGGPLWQLAGSIAVSPDGQTLVVTKQSEMPAPSAHAKYFTALPGPGYRTAVFTFDVRSPQRPVFVGCAGNFPGCAAPSADMISAYFAPNDPEPYLLSKWAGHDIETHRLVTGPTLRFGRISAHGPNPATIACPPARAQRCRGTIVLSRLASVASGEGGSFVPSVRRFRTVHYTAAPGATTKVSLRLGRRGLASYRKLQALNREPYRGSRWYAGILVQVNDATATSGPTGVTACLSTHLKTLNCMY
jgi:hypothetical protein